ncbi:MAG: tyrosine-type recombinase/integrase [Clostridia bacterium]|nr:tyrosine-type recombinase/integrase [Clostridia bacterium]
MFQLKNGKYIARCVLGYYTDDDGKKHVKRVSKVFAKKSDAIASLSSLKQTVERQKDITLHDLYDRYTNSKEYDGLSYSQRDKLGFAWNRWKELEFRGINTLTVADIETQIEKKTKSFYPAHDMKVLLSHLYKQAIKMEIAHVNKTENVDIPFDAPKAKRETWTQKEIDLLWSDYTDHPFTAYILIMCYAGLRFGELSAIKLADIHLEESYMIGGIKTEAGIDREIPIHDRIKPLIESIISNRKQKLLEMNEDNFYTAYWETIDRAGLRRLPPHTCRHYFFSRMTAEGIQGGVIAEVGGHASYLTTLKNYVRISLADKLKAVNQI